MSALRAWGIAVSDVEESALRPPQVEDQGVARWCVHIDNPID